MVRRLAPEEKALWGRVMATVKPLVPGKTAPVHVAKPASPAATKSRSPEPVEGRLSAKRPSIGSGLRFDGQNASKETAPGHLDSTWDRRIHKGGVIPDISVDLHETTLSGAYVRLDRTLDQAIHRKLRVVLLVTGHARGHDRASGQGRGAIAAVVRDWLAASRHASAISAVRQAHPRHGGAGALYIVLKR
jgi:DNA-nicking Smr family endonuclease